MAYTNLTNVSEAVSLVDVGVAVGQISEMFWPMILVALFVILLTNMYREGGFHPALSASAYICAGVAVTMNILGFISDWVVTSVIVVVALSIAALSFWSSR